MPLIWDGEPSFKEIVDHVAKQEDLYYIQNKGYCGNCLIWWRTGGHGYTSNLDEAWKVTKEEADRICAGRRPTEDYAWPVSRIDAIAHRHVNSEVLRAKYL